LASLARLWIASGTLGDDSCFAVGFFVADMVGMDYIVHTVDSSILTADLWSVTYVSHVLKCHLFPQCHCRAGMLPTPLLVYGRCLKPITRANTMPCDYYLKINPFSSNRDCSGHDLGTACANSKPMPVASHVNAVTARKVILAPWNVFNQNPLQVETESFGYLATYASPSTNLPGSITLYCNSPPLRST
jgi:hypothetical protein